jgi:hypothetical protein
MKNFIWTATLIWGSIATALCQNNGITAKFQISILDEAQIISIQSDGGGNVVPAFQRENINQVLSNYTINKFEKPSLLQDINIYVKFMLLKPTQLT